MTISEVHPHRFDIQTMESSQVPNSHIRIPSQGVVGHPQQGYPNVYGQAHPHAQTHALASHNIHAHTNTQSQMNSHTNSQTYSQLPPLPPLPPTLPLAQSRSSSYMSVPPTGSVSQVTNPSPLGMQVSDSQDGLARQLQEGFYQYQADSKAGEIIPTEHDDQEEEDNEDEDDEDEDVSSEESVDEDVAEDMLKFEESFKRLRSRYRLINRIGEGTFSVVYKAEDLAYNSSSPEQSDGLFPTTSASARKSCRYVAIKKIYVTSSPSRIFNELQLLYDLRNAESVCPLINAFRHEDQVIAILAHFPHDDFRDFFTKMKIVDVKTYLRSLFTALRSVHHEGVIHRDIKPTNFLYSTAQRTGVLVDFGLAERQGTEYRSCLCELPSEDRQTRHQSSRYMGQLATGQHTLSYPKHDSRPSRRANRAGTRGFRAPEVLFKCTAQTTAIDIWSVGVILLTFLTRRFPFFQSCDDVDALLELVNVFGKKKIRDAGLLHGQIFHTNIPSYRDYGPTFEKLILWCRNAERDPRYVNPLQSEQLLVLQDGERLAIEFMERCFEFDPSKRITAAQALEHPFLANIPAASLSPSGEISPSY